MEANCGAPETLTIATPSATIRALTWGDPDDRVAILIHGFPDSAWTWEVVGPMLAARGWYVVAPFTRGYAPSSLATNDDYSIGSLVGDVLAVYDFVGADQRTILIGSDWGGVIVSATSASHPELFAHATVLAVPPMGAVWGLTHPLRNVFVNAARLVRQAPRSWYMPVVATPLSEYLGRFLIAILWRLWVPNRNADRYRDLGLAALHDRPRRRAAFCYYRAIVNPLYRRDRRFAMEQRFAMSAMRNRTLYLHGADDTCGRVDSGAHALDYLPPGSKRVVLPNTGHFLHIDDPDATVAAIESHLIESGIECVG